jgi:hypothetical protein
MTRKKKARPAKKKVKRTAAKKEPVARRKPPKKKPPRRACPTKALAQVDKDVLTSGIYGRVSDFRPDRDATAGQVGEARSPRDALTPTRAVRVVCPGAV